MLAIMKGETPRPPPEIDVSNSERQHLWKLCRQCWNTNPLERPSMETIVVCGTFVKMSRFNNAYKEGFEERHKQASDMYDIKTNQGACGRRAFTRACA